MDADPALLLDIERYPEIAWLRQTLHEAGADIERLDGVVKDLETRLAVYEPSAQDLAEEEQAEKRGAKPRRKRFHAGAALLADVAAMQLQEPPAKQDASSLLLENTALRGLVKRLTEARRMGCMARAGAACMLDALRAAGVAKGTACRSMWQALRGALQDTKRALEREGAHDEEIQSPSAEQVARYPRCVRAHLHP